MPNEPVGGILDEIFGIRCSRGIELSLWKRICEVVIYVGSFIGGYDLFIFLIVNTVPLGAAVFIGITAMLLFCYAIAKHGTVMLDGPLPAVPAPAAS